MVYVSSAPPFFFERNTEQNLVCVKGSGTTASRANLYGLQDDRSLRNFWRCSFAEGDRGTGKALGVSGGGGLHSRFGQGVVVYMRLFNLTVPYWAHNAQNVLAFLFLFCMEKVAERGTRQVVREMRVGRRTGTFTCFSLSHGCMQSKTFTACDYHFAC
jgi:hypothetical protein